MKTKLLSLTMLFFLAGCANTEIKKETHLVFPDFPNIYSAKNLSVADVSTILVMPVYVENIPNKQYTTYFADILINALLKMNIQGVLVEDVKNLDACKNKFKTSIVCDVKLLYQYNPASAEAQQKLSGSSSTYVGPLLGQTMGAGGSSVDASGEYSSKGNYYKFIGATCKIKNVDNGKILFADEVNTQGTESKAIKRMIEHLSICLANKDVDTYRMIFLRNFYTQQIEGVEKDSTTSK